MLGRRSTTPTRPRGLGVGDPAAGFVVDDADGGPPAPALLRKNGGAPVWATMVPMVKLG
jgi:hypothetical protein